MTDNPSQIQSSNQDVQNLYSDLEKDLLYHIIDNMRHRKLTTNEAQKLAQEFLALLPSRDKEDLLRKLNILGQKYSEAKSVFAKYGALYDEEQRERKIHEMLQHIKAGNIEQAIAVAKGANQ